MNGVVFDKGKTGAIKHALSSILTFDEIPTKLISSSQSEVLMDGVSYNKSIQVRN